MSASASLLTIGLNHQTAPLDVRGRFALSATQIPAALLALKDRLSQLSPEVALLSTCNRTELYMAAPHLPAQSLNPLVAATTQWLATQGDVATEALQHHLYVMENRLAARHAFRVASGLDSMVLGETQILGQMKTAVRDADSAGLLGTTLHQLFQRSFAVAKEVRTATEIGTHSISMAAAAVRLAGDLFEDMRSVHVLFVGAGEMIELAATHFAARQPRSMALANRTLERGEKLAARIGAQPLRLADLTQCLHDYDVVVSCTASTLPIIGLGAVERALKARKHRPIFMVDLAVPRDIEQEVKALDDVYLYTVDDLASVVQTAQASRQAAMAQAEVIVDAGVQDFLRWMALRSEGSTSLIQQLNAQSDAWRLSEIARAKRLLAKGEDIDTVLDALSRGVAQKFLHPAFSQLSATESTERAAAQDAVQLLYLKPSFPRTEVQTP